MFRPIDSIIHLEIPTASVVFPAYSQPITIRFNDASSNDRYDTGRGCPGACQANRIISHDPSAAVSRRPQIHHLVGKAAVTDCFQGRDGAPCRG